MIEILSRIERAFTVADIMVPADKLQCADSVAEAEGVFRKYNVAPYRRTGLITGFYQRGSDALHEIRSSDLVAESTQLSSLVRLMTDRAFYFVQAGNGVAGFVHFSDLNNLAVKVRYFVLFERLESSLWSRLSERIKESDIRAVIGRARASRIEAKRHRRAKNDTDLGWIGLFSFSEILKIARHYELASLAGPDLKLLTDCRNRVCHADRPLIAARRDVASLVRVEDLCHQLQEAMDGACRAETDPELAPGRLEPSKVLA